MVDCVGMVERLYKEVGFEVCFEGSKSELMDYRWKRVPGDLDLKAERSMAVQLEFFSEELSAVFRN